MHEYPKDIFTEPLNLDVNTLRNLGPLTPMAGTWQGTRGLDIKPKSEGPRKQAYIERLEMQAIDPQTNGPQLFYGLRYHMHAVKPDQIKTYHEQVGYWLWEPATSTIIHTITIPRGQVLMAIGNATQDAKTFELVASKGSETNGICSNPFLIEAFKTVEFRINVTIHPNGTWSYEEDTILLIHGNPEPFHHTDKNTLTKIQDPSPNPLALN